MAHSFIELCLCFQTVVLEQTLESLLDCREIKPVNPRGNQPWIFIGRTDADAETPILWSPDVMNQLIGKPTFPDAGKDWGQEKRATENEMVGCYYWFNGREFEQTLGGSGGQGSLACCSSWGCKESDTTEWLNNIDKVFVKRETSLGESHKKSASHSASILFYFTTFFPKSLVLHPQIIPIEAKCSGTLETTNPKTLHKMNLISALWSERPAVKHWFLPFVFMIWTFVFCLSLYFWMTAHYSAFK